MAHSLNDVDPTVPVTIGDMMATIQHLMNGDEVPNWGATWYALARAQDELAKAAKFAARNDGKECEHPGVFATDRPSEFCPRCQQEVPRHLL